MKENKLTKILEEIGLSKNEAEVYLVSLTLGPSTILQMTRAAEMKRTTVYSLVEALKMKGLMSIELRGLKKLYVPLNPAQLEGVLEARKNKLHESLPEFLALYNLKGGEGFIRYYEGLEAVKGVYEDLLRDIRPHEDYLIISAQEQIFSLDDMYFQNFIERRAKLDINIRLLLEDSPTARKHKQFERNYNERIKILPASTSLSTNMVITPRKLVIHQLSLPVIAITIENTSIIKMHRELFELLWKSTV